MEGKLMAVPIYVWNGTAWESTGPTIPASPIKYQASAPSSPSTGDIWVDSDADVTTGSQQFQRFRFVASGGETTISGADANGAVLAYTAGLEQVVLNGAVLVRGHDYTATNGTSITGLSPALVASDVLEVFSFIAFTVANTYTQSQVDGLVSAAPGMKLVVPTSVTSSSGSVSVDSNGKITLSSATAVKINGCFTSSYDNYRIVFNGNNTSSTVSGTSIKFLSAGTEAASNYYYTYIYASNSAGPSRTYAAAQTALSSGALGDYLCSHTYEVMQPALATNTNVIGNYVAVASAGNETGSVGAFHTTASSYDGFIFAGGTMSGTFRIYGYKN